MSELTPSLIDEIVQKRSDFIASVNEVRQTETALYMASHVNVMTLGGSALESMGITNKDTMLRANLEWHRAEESFQEAGTAHLISHHDSALRLKLAFLHFEKNKEAYFELALAEARSASKETTFDQKQLAKKDLVVLENND